jgi:hypothetical protein
MRKSLKAETLNIQLSPSVFAMFLMLLGEIHFIKAQDWEMLICRNAGET